MRVNKKSVLYSSALLTVSSVILQLLGFGYRILLGRVAGPQVVAVHSLVLSAYNVVLSCTLTGIALSVSRIASAYQALGSGKSIKKLIRTALVLFLLLFSLLAIPFGFCREFFASNVLGNPDTAPALLLLLPCLFLTGFENVHKAFFYGTKRNIPPMISEILEMLLRISSALILFSIAKNLSTAAAACLIIVGMIFSEIASASFLTLVYRSSRRNLPGKDDIPTRRILSDIASVAVPISLSTLVSRLLSAANVVLIPRTLMASGLSYTDAMSRFGIVSGMTLPMLMVPAAFLSPLITVLTPRFSAENALGGSAQIRRKAGKAIHVTGLIGIPAMAAMLSMGKAVAVLLYNNPSAGDYLLPLTLTTLLSFYYSISESVLESIGLQKRCSWLTVAASFLGVVCTGIVGGYMRLGIAGFLCGEFLCALIGAVFCLTWLSRSTGLSFQWKNWFAVPLISAALATLISRPLLLFLLGAGVVPVLAVVFCFLLFVLLYSVFLRLLGTDFPTYIRETLR